MLEIDIEVKNIQQELINETMLRKKLKKRLLFRDHYMIIGIEY